MGDRGFLVRKQPIVIPYADASVRSVMGPDWLAENFTYDDGVPGDMKDGPDYLVRYQLDTQGEGKFVEAEPNTINDLVLENRHHDGVIWLRAFPVSAIDVDKEPEVMLRRWLRSFSGPRTVLTLREGVVTSATRHLVAEPERIETCKMAERAAAMARVRFADAEQDRIAPGARVREVVLVLVRTGFDWKYRLFTFPSWMVVAYVNDVADFERGLPAFHGLLHRIRLGGREDEADSGGEGFPSGFVCMPADAARPPSAALEAPAPADAPTPAEPAAAPASAPAPTGEADASAAPATTGGEPTPAPAVDGHP